MTRNKILSILRNPQSIIYSLGYRGYFKWMSDEKYLKLVYKTRVGKKLNLENPTTYNEKLQWLKLNNKDASYSDYVDKYRVRQIVTNKIGQDYLIPILGVYDNFNDINLKTLPKRFVLKCTHDSGGVIVCEDKDKLNINKTKKKLEKRMRRNYYWSGREYPYKHIKPRIIIEKFMEDNEEKELKDFKFFCFNGVVKAIYLVSGRGTPNMTADFLTEDFERLPYIQEYPRYEGELKKPQMFEKMIYLAEILAKDFQHVRIDFYEVNGKIYFGEYTFYHFSGLKSFKPSIHDRVFGELLKL